MAATVKRKTSLTLDSDALDAAKEFGVNVSAVADKALRDAVEEARERRWLDENAETFAAQAAWHEKNGHPLADILAGPVSGSWKN